MDTDEVKINLNVVNFTAPGEIYSNLVSRLLYFSGMWERSGIILTCFHYGARYDHTCSSPDGDPVTYDQVDTITNTGRVSSPTSSTIPTITNKPTRIPPSTETPPPTMDVWEVRNATEIAIFPGCGTPIEHDYSPDGQWVALECDYMTGVYNLNDLSKAWSLKYNEIFGIADKQENYSIMISPTHWSVDGRYLYLTIRPFMDGGCPKYGGGISLIRLDLLTGKIIQTLRLTENGFGLYEFSFSKDDAYLAYFQTWIDHPILNIRNSINGDERHIPLGEQYNEAGNVIWSPDKSRIIFSARSGENCENLVYYLVMMNLDNLKQTILLEGPTFDYYPIDWTEENNILLDLGALGYGSLNLATKEITPYLTPTPTPNPNFIN